MTHEKEPRKLGRPPLPQEHRKTARMELRLTSAQRAKVDRNGGPAWGEKLIDAARDGHS